MFSRIANNTLKILGKTLQHALERPMSILYGICFPFFPCLFPCHRLQLAKFSRYKHREEKLLLQSKALYFPFIILNNI